MSKKVCYYLLHSELWFNSYLPNRKHPLDLLCCGLFQNILHSLEFNMIFKQFLPVFCFVFFSFLLLLLFFCSAIALSGCAWSPTMVRWVMCSKVTSSLMPVEQIIALDRFDFFHQLNHSCG